MGVAVATVGVAVAAMGVAMAVMGVAVVVWVAAAPSPVKPSDATAAADADGKI